MFSSLVCDIVHNTHFHVNELSSWMHWLLNVKQNITMKAKWREWIFNKAAYVARTNYYCCYHVHHLIAGPKNWIECNTEYYNIYNHRPVELLSLWALWEWMYCAVSTYCLIWTTNYCTSFVPFRFIGGMFDNSCDGREGDEMDGEMSISQSLYWNATRLPGSIKLMQRYFSF